MLQSIVFCAEKKIAKYRNIFSKECNELLAIHYLILGVTVPLQLLVTAIKNLKCNENVSSFYKKELVV
jgi:hypothetical protein